MPRTTIDVIGAKQNNLKNVSVEIPRDKLTVITGVSGSGKSSLAFDVIYGEAQRRFLESISNFARGFIGQVKRPKVDFVRGLSPVIAIEQKKGSSNPRSTVGTVTDINGYLRLLMATVGLGECPECGLKLEQVSAAKISEHVLSLPAGSVVEIRVPVSKVYGEDHKFLFTKIREKGYRSMLIDGEPHDLSDKLEVDEAVDHTLEVIVDRLVVRREMYIQTSKTIEAAMVSMGEDIFLKVEVLDTPVPVDLRAFYAGFGCPDHHHVLYEMQGFHFSFNMPAGACNTCSGIGKSRVVEPRFLIVSPEKSIAKGALSTNVFNPQGKDSYRTAIVYSLAEKYGFSLDTPFNMLGSDIHDLLFYGTKGEPVKIVQPPFAKKRNWIVGREFPFGGFVNDIQSWYRHYVNRSAATESVEPDFIKTHMTERTCPECGGTRLRKQRLSVRVHGRNIDELCRMSLPALVAFLRSLQFPPSTRDVAQSITNEITSKVQLLVDIGLHYLNLGRSSDTISGGEMQRIKMSTQISSELMGMLYVMDEPSIGLHARDSVRVINIMKKLRDIGNTVIVVEHDAETMRHADHLIEIGPGPGIHGGRVVAAGDYGAVTATATSVTGSYLSGKRFIGMPVRRRPMSDGFITVQGARQNNLKDITVDIPLGLFVCVTGVSGSGKSTLINDTLFKELEILKKGARIVAGDHDFVLGSEQVSTVTNIDQSPIGRSSKSNPATYIGLYDRIRNLFAATDEAVSKGYKPIDFSLMHANGTRCEHCTGDGVIVTNLQFMADIEAICPVCKGARFSQEGLEVKYHGRNIAEVLEMTAEEALAFFSHDRYLKHKLAVVNELGLGYLTLGQSSTTLSGGEAQRVKLAYELGKMKRGSHNLYILDEPTTGLHFSDIERLLGSLNRLVDAGHSVLVIEHNLDVIKSCDYVIDMGPEGGEAGGCVVAEGTPEHVATVEGSFTGQFLRAELERVRSLEAGLEAQAAVPSR